MDPAGSQGVDFISRRASSSQVGVILDTNVLLFWLAAQARVPLSDWRCTAKFPEEVLIFVAAVVKSARRHWTTPQVITEADYWISKGPTHKRDDLQKALMVYVGIAAESHVTSRRLMSTAPYRFLGIADVSTFARKSTPTVVTIDGKLALSLAAAGIPHINLLQALTPPA